MDIRPLTAADAEAWWHLRLEALRNDPASFADSAEEHQNTSIEAARERLQAGNAAGNFVMGLFEGGALAGTAGFFRRRHRKECHKGHIWGVYVQPQSRGKGAGKALLQEVLRRAREIPGLEQITLVASAFTHLPARRMYESLGFQPYGVEPRSLKIGAEYIDDVLMVLWLRP